MSVLLDTNILTRLAQQTHPQHGEAQSAVGVLVKQGESLHIVPQNLYEFWAVATRPIAANGLGLTIDKTKAEIARIRSLFTMLSAIPAVYTEWERLVEFHEVIGKAAHDARLVAAMIVHHVTRILSFNDRDFSRYPHITTINPAAIIARPQT